MEIKKIEEQDGTVTYCVVDFVTSLVDLQKLFNMLVDHINECTDLEQVILFGDQTRSAKEITIRESTIDRMVKLTRKV